MRALIFACVAAVLAVPGCAVRHSSSVSSSALGNAIIQGIVMGDTIQYYGFGLEGRTQVGPPELDPDRKINLQDCTRPVDASAGNLMCR